jgi:pimeloyl-ACP methyl ester carboxylesterase
MGCAQAKALIDWCASKDPDHAISKAIRQPVLVLSGIDDTMLPDTNAYLMFKHLKNAQLILYPDSGHGALFQYPKTFVNHALLFLNGQVSAGSANEATMEFPQFY